MDCTAKVPLNMDNQEVKALLLYLDILKAMDCTAKVPLNMDNQEVKANSFSGNASEFPSIKKKNEKYFL